ncbi:FUSC family protein [Tsukamurella paurometabola]|uniref:FUSC family protein n=1 Tax=Tsukamurella paurometabola TaxID=2061 RepID=A0A3P8MCM5_TSUPA|nr:FUSC family protein [Tsukamurella paurometabola]MBS4104127.1 FUSC family protein [Tsukamurella paurometabola]UEA85346.1 FUSC family protein [Tsukamurella paurometabola]VDR37963.1 Predicted membrane protein [Tsukamurella paurometabola]
MTPKPPARSDSARSRLVRRHNALPQVIQSRTKRLWNAKLPILQCAVAAGIAWFIANDVIGHVSPFFAPIAAIISLGLSLNQRLRRSLELVGGVTVGIGVGDLLISVIGTGPWQLALVVAIAMAVAVLADRGPLVPMQAASSAVLVATLLPPGSTGGWTRMLDALIGGLVGVVIVALIPNNPARRPRKDAAKVLDTMRRVTASVAAGLTDRDISSLEWALETARATQPDLDQLSSDLAGGIEITKVAPMFWSSRQRMDKLQAIADPLDNAVRNVRVMARRALGSNQAGEKIDPALVTEIGRLADAFKILRDVVLAEPGTQPDQAEAARVLRSSARRANALHLEESESLNEVMIYGQLRSTIVDLLQVAGLSRTSAVAQMRDVPKKKDAAPKPAE